MRPPDTTIVIAQRNHEELTRKCIMSLRLSDPVAWPIVVVDDGSDRLSMPLEELTSVAGVRVVRLGRHRGVSAAWDAGARRVRTPLVMFLNNDVVCWGPWVERLTRPLRRTKAAITGAAWREERAVDRRLLARFGNDGRFLEGWCLAMSIGLWQALGGFDESLRYYFSDTDLQLRSQVRFGGSIESCIDKGELGGTSGMSTRVREALLDKPAVAPNFENAGANNARRFGRALQAVEGLPLVHLGHRTAHDPQCLPDRIDRWRSDRQRFVKKLTSFTTEAQRHGDVVYSLIS